MRSLPFACCAFVLASLGSAGCAHYETVAVGEALTVGDGRVSPALAVEAAMGTGSSRDGGSVFAQTRARGIVGPVRQQIAGFAGVSTLRWISERAPLWLHLDVGPGLEHYSGTLFFEAIAHAKVGSGVVLAQVVEPYAPLDPWASKRTAPRDRSPSTPSTPSRSTRRLRAARSFGGACFSRSRSAATSMHASRGIRSTSSR